MEGESRKGPYSTENIQQLLNEGKISLVTLIKNQFVMDWKLAGECFEFNSYDESSAISENTDLPNIPEIENSFEFEESLDSSTLDEASSSPLDIDSLEGGNSLELNEEEFDFTDEVIDDSISENSSKVNNLSSIERHLDTVKIKNTYFSRGVLILLITIVGSLSFFFLSGKSEVVDISSINPNNAGELNKVRFEDYDRKVQVAFSLNRKGTTLWASTNLKLNAQVFLEMKSIDGKVLSDEPIVFRSQAFLKSGMINFKDFKLDEGEKLVAGKYEIEMSLVPYGVGNKLASFFKGSFIGNLNMVSRYSQTYEFRGEMLVYGGDSTDFSKQLKDFSNLKLEENLKFHIDRLEKFKTFISFVNLIKGMYLEALNKMKSGRDIKKFIIPYGKKVAPILQDMIIDNHYKHEEFKSLDPMKAKGYSENFEYGKLVAAYASNLSEMTKGKNQVGPRTRSSLRSRAIGMSIKLNKEGLEYSDTLSAQISSIRAEFKKSSL